MTINEDIKLPHVSSILKPWQNIPFVTEESLIRGQNRHKAYASYLLSVWSPPVDPRDEGQLASFRSWADQHVKDVGAVEMTLHDDGLGFCGTIDAILYTDLGEGAILFDFKPPWALSKVYWVQLATYLHLANVLFVVNKAGFIRPDPFGGICRVDWMPENKPDIFFPVFLSALNCYRFFNGG